MRQSGFVFALFVSSLGMECSTLCAQNLLVKGEAKNPDYIEAQNFYQAQIGTGSELFRGREFIEYGNQFEGDPFFEEDWAEGSVFYDSVQYANITMRYDLVADVVLVDHINLANSIRLESSKVAWFSILDHHFIRIHDKSQTGIVPPGFYDVLVDDKVKLLVKRKKVQKEAIDEAARRVRYWFELQSEFYVMKDGAYHKIRTKGALVSLLSDHKKEIKKFIRKCPVKFSTAPEEVLKRTIDYQNQLE